MKFWAEFLKELRSSISQRCAAEVNICSNTLYSKESWGLKDVWNEDAVSHYGTKKHVTWCLIVEHKRGRWRHGSYFGGFIDCISYQRPPNNHASQFCHPCRDYSLLFCSRSLPCLPVRSTHESYLTTENTYNFTLKSKCIGDEVKLKQYTEKLNYQTIF